MKIPYINIITKNPGKINVARSVFSKYGIEVKQLDFEIPEIQADNSLIIARHTAEEAYKKFKEPIIREDHSFYINELGIPGPYMSYMEKRVSVGKLLNILSCLKDRTGFFEIATVFINQKGKKYEFSFKVPIILENTIKGSPNTGWSQIMRVENEKNIFTEYPEEERYSVWGQNFEKIAKLISKA